MTTHEGDARVLAPDGTVIEPRVKAYITDDPETRPSYVTSGFYGEFWVTEGDLMAEPLRTNPNCVLEWLNATRAHKLAVRVNSWTEGGRRAQVIV